MCCFGAPAFTSDGCSVVTIGRRTMIIHHQHFTLFNDDGGAIQKRYIGSVLTVLRECTTRIVVRDSCTSHLIRTNVSIDSVPIFDNLTFATSCTVAVNNSNAFLRATAHVRSLNVPLVNIGANHLNFLTRILPHRFTATVRTVCDSYCALRHRSLLSIAIAASHNPLS